MLKPKPDVIECIKDAIPYFLIGDLSSQHLANERVLRALTEEKQLYNYRQSRACLPTENDTYCEVGSIFQKVIIGGVENMCWLRQPYIIVFEKLKISFIAHTGLQILRQVVV